MTEEPSRFTITLSYKGPDERPAFTSLGDILKSIQTVFNYFASMEGIKKDTTFRIAKIASGSIVIDTLVSIGKEIAKKIFDKVKTLWSAFQVKKERGVLEKLEIPNTFFELCKKQGIDIEKMRARDIDDLADEDKEQLESIDPFITIKLKIVTHVRRSSTWIIHID